LSTPTLMSCSLHACLLSTPTLICMYVCMYVCMSRILRKLGCIQRGGFCTTNAANSIRYTVSILISILYNTVLNLKPEIFKCPATVQLYIETE
jgi:hypothetical protein